MNKFLILPILYSFSAFSQSFSPEQQKIDQENVWKQQKIDQENMWFNAQLDEYFSLIVEGIENECINEVAKLNFKTVLACKVAKVKEQADKLKPAK